MSTEIGSGEEEFTFRANGTGQPRAVVLGVVSALRAVGVTDKDDPTPRFTQIDRLKQHVRDRGLAITDDEADNLLRVLDALDQKKRTPTSTPTSPTGSTSTPSP